MSLVLKRQDLDNFFKERVIKGEPDNNLKGEPYIRLNHSEWLGLELHSGGMIDAKMVWTAQTFSNEKEPIVVFETSKLYVQMMVKGSGAFYLQNHAKDSLKKTKYTTTLRELCQFNNANPDLPNSIKNALNTQCRLGFSNRFLIINKFISHWKGVVRDFEDMLDLKFLPEDIQDFLNFARKIAFTSPNVYAKSFATYLNKNIPKWINKSIVQAKEQGADIKNLELIEQKWLFISKTLNLRVAGNIKKIYDESVKKLFNPKWNRFFKIFRDVSELAIEIGLAVVTDGATVGAEVTTRALAKTGSIKKVGELSSKIADKSLESIRNLNSLKFNKTRAELPFNIEIENDVLKGSISNYTTEDLQKFSKKLVSVNKSVKYELYIRDALKKANPFTFESFLTSYVGYQAQELAITQKANSDKYQKDGKIK